MDYGSVPQWITALIAAIAACVALCAIRTQREIARKRAAVDVFIKTEMDPHMLTGYDSFYVGIGEMRKAKTIEEFCQRDDSRKHYYAVRKYLNVHELIAVGITKGVLDEKVCYDFWADILVYHYNDAKPLLDYLATRPKNRYTYLELHWLFDKWNERKKKTSLVRPPPAK